MPVELSMHHSWKAILIFPLFFFSILLEVSLPVSPSSLVLGMGHCAVPSMLCYHVKPPQAPLPGSGSLSICADLLLRVTIPTATLVVTLLVPKARNFHHIRPIHTILMPIVKCTENLRQSWCESTVSPSVVQGSCLAKLCIKAFQEEIGILLAVSQMRKEWPVTSLQAKEDERMPGSDGPGDRAVFCSAAVLL